MPLKWLALSLVPITSLFLWLVGWPMYSALFLFLLVLLIWWRYRGVRDLLQDIWNILLRIYA